MSGHIAGAGFAKFAVFAGILVRWSIRCLVESTREYTFVPAFVEYVPQILYPREQTGNPSLVDSETISGCS